MKAWAVRVVTLYVYSTLLLVVIGWLTPARVGWAALWAGLVLTVATLWIRPVVLRLFQRAARRDAGEPRARFAEAGIQVLLYLAVAGLVWWLLVVFTPVRVGGWFWGWILPPLLLAIGWVVYDAIDDAVETRAHAAIDRVRGVDAAA